MRIPIIDIGNSKGIRIPKAVLQQTLLGKEVDMEIIDGRIILKRAVNPEAVPEFDSIAKIDDQTIQRMLRKITVMDLITALIGADETAKEAVYRNLAKRVRVYTEDKVAKLEKGDAKDILIEQSRSTISEAFMEVMAE